MKHLKELQFLAMANKLSTQVVVDNILQSSESKLRKMEETHVLTLNNGDIKSEADLYRFHLDRIDISTVSPRLQDEIEAAQAVMRSSQYNYIFNFDEDELGTTL